MKRQVHGSLLGRSSKVVWWHEKAEITPSPPASKLNRPLDRRENLVILEGRGDNVVGVHLPCSIDKSRQRLQYLRIGMCVVVVGVAFVVPQTDRDHINSTGPSESDFVLKAILLTKYRCETPFRSAQRIRLCSQRRGLTGITLKVPCTACTMVRAEKQSFAN